MKNTAHFDLNDRNMTNARFIQANQLPQIDSHLTAKLYVDTAVSVAIDEPPLLRLDPHERLKRSFILLNSTLTTIKTVFGIPTKNMLIKNSMIPV